MLKNGTKDEVQNVSCINPIDTFFFNNQLYTLFLFTLSFMPRTFILAVFMSAILISRYDFYSYFYKPNIQGHISRFIIIKFLPFDISKVLYVISVLLPDSVALCSLVSFLSPSSVCGLPEGFLLLNACTYKGD